MGKQKNKIFLLTIIALLCSISAFALLKTGVFGNENNFLATDGSTRYDIVVDLGEGGKFEPSAKPEFTKMDNGKWIHRYQPSAKPVKLPTPVKDGYEFVGWIEEGDATAKPEYSIPAWNKKNIKLRAEWRIIESTLVSGIVFNSIVEGMEGFDTLKGIKFEKAKPNLDGVDFSLAKDRSIMGIITDNVLTIACEGDIYANSSCYDMFRGFGSKEYNSLNENLTSIIFSNFNTSRVKNMHGMFRNCESLVELNLQEFNTSNVVDMCHMFSECESLESIDLSSFDTKNATDMTGMFYYCKNLIKLDVSSFNTSQVTNMREMFYYCKNLIRLDVSNFNTVKVTDMRDMFVGCSGLVGLDLHSFDTSQVKYMSAMFGSCSGLVSLDVSNFDTSSVTSMYSMFGNCSRLEVLDLSNFKTSNVTDMHRMFDGCSQLIDLNLSSFDTSQVTNMYRMFNYCKSLKSINLNSFNTSNVRNMSGMFSNCSSLIELDLSGFDTSQVTIMEEMFSRCLNLMTANVDKFDFSNTRRTVRMFIGCPKLSGEITINNPTLNDTVGMFSNCSSESNSEFWVKWVSPETKEIAREMVQTKYPNMENHVYLWEPDSTLERGMSFNRRVVGINGFNNVTEIRFVKGTPNPSGTDLSDKQDKSIIGSIENNILTIACAGKIYANPDSSFMFSNFGDISQVSGNKVLNKITFENFDTSKVTDMESMFGDCYNLKQMNLSRFNTGNVENMRSMFSGCKKLEMLDVSNFNTSKVKNMSYMFAVSAPARDMHENYLASSLSEIIGLDKLDTSNVIDMSGMFSGCHGLASLNVSNFDTSNVTNMSRMFAYCGSDPINPDPANPDSCGLRTINGLDKFNTSKVANMNRMFAGCNSLKILNLSNFDTSKVTSMYGMFADCFNLNKIVGLENLNIQNVSDASYMFTECDNLSGEITFTDPNMKIYHMFDGCSTNKGTMFIVKYENSCKTLAQNATQQVGTMQFRHVYLYGEDYMLDDGDTFNQVIKNIPNFDKVKHIKFVKGSPTTGAYVGRRSASCDMYEKNMNPTDPEPPTGPTDPEEPDYLPSNFNPNYLQIICSKCAVRGNIEGDILYISAVAEGNIYASNKNGSMSNMFKDMPNIETITFDNFNTSEVDNMSNAFTGCTNLQSLDLGNFNTAKVESMSGVFENCSNLETINLNNVNMVKVTDTSRMFKNCSKLSGEITINKSVGSYQEMFLGCSSGYNAKFIVKYKDAQTKELARKMVNTKNPNDHVYLYGVNASTLMKGSDFNSIFGGRMYDNITAIEFIEGTPNPNGVDCSLNLDKSIMAEVSGTTLKVVCDGEILANPDSFRMFYGLADGQAGKKLNSIKFDNFNTKNVTDMSSMFWYCSNLKTLDLSNWNTSKVTNMNEMFWHCGSLVSVKIDSWDTSNVTHMSGMFESCYALGVNDFSPLKFDNVINTQYMFMHCANLDTTICINNDNIWQSIMDTFSNTSKLSGKVIVNYEPGCKYQAQQLVNTKSARSNVLLGQEIISLKSTIKNRLTRSITPTNKPVTLTLNNGPSAQYIKQVVTVQNNRIPNLTAPELNPKYAGQFGGYYYDEQFTKPVKQGDIITRDLTIYARW